MGELIQEQSDYEFYQEVKRSLDTPVLTRFHQSTDGFLCRKGHRSGSQQLRIPLSPVEDALREEHSSPLDAHPDGSRMYQTLRDHYFWPSLAADVCGWVAECPTEAKIRLMGIRSRAYFRLFPDTEPVAALAVDLVGPLPRIPERYEYMFVNCDRFAEITRAVPLKNLLALDIVSALLDT